MSMIKYRVHEVAKDFNVASKVISQILTDYIAPPKNHMQVLENPELDVIFEYMTQHNQVESLEDIFKVSAPAKAPEKPAEQPKAAEKPAAAGKPMVSLLFTPPAPQTSGTRCTCSPRSGSRCRCRWSGGPGYRAGGNGCT